MNFLYLLILAAITVTIPVDSWQLEEENKLLKQEIHLLKEIRSSCIPRENSHCIAAEIDYEIFKIKQECNLIKRKESPFVCASYTGKFFEKINDLKRIDYTDTAIDKLKVAERMLVEPEDGIIAISRRDLYDKLCVLYVSKGKLFYPDAATYCCEYRSPLCREVSKTGDS